MAPPGRADANAIRRMRRSWLRRGSRGRFGRIEGLSGNIEGYTVFSELPRRSARDSLQPVSLEAAVERASAEPERLCCLADVAVEARHGLLDEERLDLLEAHVLEPPSTFTASAETEVGGLH